MKRFFSVVILTVLVFSVAFSFMPFPTVKADITETRTFTASSSDSDLGNVDSDYSTCRTAITGAEPSTPQWLFIGQADLGLTYEIYRTFLFFDSSLIPNSATINNATLSLYVNHDYSDDDFNVTIQSGAPTYPHNPVQSGDYFYNWYSGDGGSANTSTISGEDAYWNITLNSDGLDMISLTGTTKLCLRSSNDIDGTEPTGYEYIECADSSGGASYAAKLYVTYTVSTGDVHGYNVYGPYLDSPTGTVYNGYVNVTVYPNYEESQNFILNGTGGTADSESLYFEQQPLMMTWNVSEAGNYTRTFYFTDATTEDIYIFIPDPEEPFYYYSFSIIDMHGISNGFLESRIYLDGEYKVVERQSASAINALPFIMQWSVPYKLRVVCDQGTFSAGDFTALNEANQNIVIPNGAFPTTQYGFNITVACLRMNSTLIQMNYTDSAETTIWVHLKITHRSGNADVTDYTENNTDNTVQVNWNSATATVDYKATVTFYRNSQVYTYIFSCPAPAEGGTNPFAFLPAPYCYAVATALTLFAGLVFSYWTVVAGAWAMTGLAGWFTWIGWFPQTEATWGIIAFAGFVSALITFARFKKTERTI